MISSTKVKYIDTSSRNIKLDEKILLQPGSTTTKFYKMYKIPDQIVQFIEKTMQTWREYLTARGLSLAEVNIRRDMFQWDALSPLLFVIAMMAVNRILRKSTSGYKLSRSQEKINHLMYMDGINFFTINEKELETLIQTLRVYSQERGKTDCSHQK